MRIGVFCSGGDAPGMNACLRAVVRSGLAAGHEVVGIRRGYQGLLEEDFLRAADYRPLMALRSVSGLSPLGGTILKTSRSEEFRTDAGQKKAAGILRKHGIDALVAIGGDGSLTIAHQLFKAGLRVVGVPKTIDNDLAATELTFGFQTAVETATDAVDKLHSTAQAHARVMVIELMGRTAGWIALEAGVAGTADVILIPEIPYDLDKVCEKIESRYNQGRRGFAMVVVAEGAYPKGGEPHFKRKDGGQIRLGGVAEEVGIEIHKRTGRETRSLVLGHLQRGGGPNAYDRLLSLRFGAAAVRLINDAAFGCMVALESTRIQAVPLGQAIARIKSVPLDSDVIATARSLGICLGD